MAINPAAYGGVSIEQAQKAVIQILNSPPQTNVLLDPPESPGRMVGYYDVQSEKVELYVVGGGGTYWLRIG